MIGKVSDAAAVRLSNLNRRMPEIGRAVRGIFLLDMIQREHLVAFKDIRSHRTMIHFKKMIEVLAVTYRSAEVKLSQLIVRQYLYNVADIVVL